MNAKKRRDAENAELRNETILCVLGVFAFPRIANN